MRKSGTTDRYRFFSSPKCISYRLLGRIRDEILWTLRIHDMFVIQCKRCSAGRLRTEKDGSK